MTIPVPDHIRGQLKARTQAAADRRDWIIRADAAGMTRQQMAAALNISYGSIWHICIRAGMRKGHTTAAATKARVEKYRAQRHGTKNGVTYAELQADGLTMQEAADRRGDGLAVAKRWSQETGLKFVDGRTRDANREIYRENLRQTTERRVEGYRAMLEDPERHRLALMTPKQRADYDRMIRAKIPADDAAAAVGCPEAGPTAWRANRKAQLARERQRRRIQYLARRSPQSALLALMAQQTTTMEPRA